MLAELEHDLVALIKASPLGQRVAVVDALPDIEGANLVKRFAADAPGIYVSLGSFPVADGAARFRAGVACVARNARGAAAARSGDGRLIGLYTMLWSVMALIEGADGWRVQGVDFMADEVLFEAGLHVGVVRIETAVAIPLGAALADNDLSTFARFDAAYDLPPHTPAAHPGWLQDTPAPGGPAPDLSDTLLLTPVTPEEPA